MALFEHYIKPRCETCQTEPAPFGKDIKTDDGKKTVYSCAKCLDETLYKKPA